MKHLYICTIIIVGINDETKDKVAVKVMSKAFLDEDDGKLYKKVLQEIEIMKSLDHPNVNKLLDVIETDKYLCIILEYAPGGDLFDAILKDSNVNNTSYFGFYTY